jgi:hypothetical protein
MSVIRLSLSTKATTGFLKSLSSNDYNELMQSALTPLDLLYTFAYRYARVVDDEIPTAHGDPVNLDGEIFRFTSQHLAVSIPTTIFFLALAAAGTYNEYRQQKKINNNGSYQFIYNRFQETSNDIEAENQRIFDLNYYFSLILREDESLKKKFKSIRINFEGAEPTLDFDPIKPIVVKKQPWYTQLKEKVIKPAWNALNIASFVYWILWIGVGVFTGNLAGAGINALPDVVAFGLPVLFALLYPFKKIYNYIRDKKANAGVTKEEKAEQEQEVLQTAAAKLEACSLLRRALLRREYDLRKETLLEQLDKIGVKRADNALDFEKVPARASSMDQQVLTLTKNKKLKAGMAFLSAMGGTYVAVQYGTWIIMDFLQEAAKWVASIPVLNILGVVLLGFTGLYGIYKACQRYNNLAAIEKNATIQAIKADKQVTDFETELTYLNKSIAIKKTKLGIPRLAPDNIKHDQDQFFTDVDRRGPSKMTRLKKILKRAFHFVNGFCTGAFLARLFFVQKTAIILPAAAVVFSNPITIGIIVGVGLLYGAFKAFEYHLNRKEQCAKLLLEQREERMECLQQQVELARLENTLLSEQVKLAKKSEKKAVEKAKQAKPEVMLVSSKNLFKPIPVSRLRSLEEGDSPRMYQRYVAKVS